MSIYLWLIIAAVAAVIEIVSNTLITLWFVIAALVSFLLGAAGIAVEIQWIVFAVVSVVCLLLIRPMALKHANKGASEEPTPIGENAVVVEEIKGKTLGRVELANHMTWAAMNAHEDALEVGANVIVVGQESAKLIVERK